MPTTTTAFSGINGTVKSGTLDMDVTGWDGDLEIDSIDVSTTAAAGWKQKIGALSSFNGSFDFLYNLAKKPTGATANLMIGSKPTLTLQATTGEVFTGVGLITKLALKSKVSDATTVTATFESDGPWAVPS